jgi:hypothetical protein
MPGARQQPCNQPPAQSAADDGKIVLPGRMGSGGMRSGMHNGVHDDDVSSAGAAERTEHKARKSRSGRTPVSSPGCALGAQNIFQGRNHGERAAQARIACASWACKVLEETGNAAVSGNFPRRYYPDRVQRDSLSLGRAFSVLVSRETRAEAPLFRHRSLKHKSETARKRGKAGGRPGQNRTAFPFVRAARTLAQCRERRGRLRRMYGRASAWLLRCISTAWIKEQLSHARNNAPARGL